MKIQYRLKYLCLIIGLSRAFVAAAKTIGHLTTTTAALTLHLAGAVIVNIIPNSNLQAGSIPFGSVLGTFNIARSTKKMIWQYTLHFSTIIWPWDSTDQSANSITFNGKNNLSDKLTLYLNTENNTALLPFATHDNGMMIRQVSSSVSGAT